KGVMLRKVETENNYTRKLIDKLNREEKAFLKANILSIISEGNYSIEGYTIDVFKYNLVRDSSASISKYTIDLLNKLTFNRRDKEKIYENSIENISDIYGLYRYIEMNKEKIKN